MDFHEVAENEKVTIMVPVETTGEAEGVKTGGGVLEHVLFKIKVRAPPKDLPEQIIVDVTKLEIGQSIDLKSPPANRGISGREKAVNSSRVARDRREAAATEAAAPRRVEMIKEKKEEGEEGAKARKVGDKAAAPAKGCGTAGKEGREEE